MTESSDGFWQHGPLYGDDFDFDAMEVGIPDAPRAGELMFALAMSRGPRIHNRMGGLASADVKGEDGLR